MSIFGRSLVSEVYIACTTQQYSRRTVAQHVSPCTRRQTAPPSLISRLFGSGGPRVSRRRRTHRNFQVPTPPFGGWKVSRAASSRPPLQEREAAVMEWGSREKCLPPSPVRLDEDEGGPGFWCRGEAQRRLLIYEQQVQTKVGRKLFSSLEVVYGKAGITKNV